MQRKTSRPRTQSHKFFFGGGHYRQCLMSAKDIISKDALEIEIVFVSSSSFLGLFIVSFFGCFSNFVLVFSPFSLFIYTSISF